MGTEAKPFLKWAGGKGQLIEQLSVYLPNKIYHEPFNYVEPFVGGGAMLFYMLKTFPNIKKVIINDVNEQLVSTYRNIRDNVYTLIGALSELEDSYLKLEEGKRKEMYLIVRDKYNTPTCTGIMKSAYMLFLNRTCFNGLYRVNGKGLFNVPFGKYANPTICNAELLKEDSMMLNKVDMEICCGDYRDTLQQVDDGLCFFYLDPPYRPLSETSSFTAYAKGDFNDDNQRELAQFCHTLDERGCLWMQSNADCSAKNPADTFFEELYADYQIERVYASRNINANASKRGKLTELLIHNQYTTK